MRHIGNPLTHERDKEDPSIYLPGANEYFGYDLFVSDWVYPYGSGINKDIELKLIKDVRSLSDYNFQYFMRFPNDGDGIQSYVTPKGNSSTFKTPYHAPKEGYGKEIVRKKHSNYNLTDKDLDGQYYFFRIRTEKDEKGNIVKSHYGIIDGNIYIRPVSSDKWAGVLGFKYYINPRSNDTNIEFDESNNLYGDKFNKED